MKNILIKSFEIPINIKQEYSDYQFVEIYDDCVICRGEKRERVFLFDNYKWICWLPVGFETRFAEIIFVGGNNIVVETDRIGLSNSEYVERLYFEIVKIFNEYKQKCPILSDRA